MLLLNDVVLFVFGLYSQLALLTGDPRANDGAFARCKAVRAAGAPAAAVAASTLALSSLRRLRGQARAAF